MGKNGFKGAFELSHHTRGGDPRPKKTDFKPRRHAGEPFVHYIKSQKNLTTVIVSKDR